VSLKQTCKYVSIKLPYLWFTTKRPNLWHNG